MKTILLAAIIGAIMSLKPNWHDIDDSVDFILLSFTGMIFGSVLGCFIALALPADVSENKNTQELVCIQDSNGITGGFLLGSGYIDSEMKYIFYVKEGNGFKMRQLDSEEAKIIYSDSPRIIEYEFRRKHNTRNMFALDFTRRSYYKIFVPKGTIKTNFDLDAK